MGYYGNVMDFLDISSIINDSSDSLRSAVAWSIMSNFIKVGGFRDIGHSFRHQLVSL